MVGLVQGFPLATQPIVDPTTGLVKQSWLNFFQGLWGNASQTSLPDGISLPPGSVDLAAFAPFLNPVGLAPNGLPNPVGYTGPAIVFSSDGNLYRYVDGAWTLDVPAAAIVGEIPLGSIPAIPTTQLTGYIQAGQIQANSIGVDQISAGYIYAGNIAASQIEAGTLGAGVILTSVLSAGQITTGTLTGITITGNTINGGTITGATIQTATSGARIAITPGVFLAGYNSAGTQTISASPNILSGYPSFSLSNPSGTLFASMGGAACIVGEADGIVTLPGLFIAQNNSVDAIRISAGGLTFSGASYIHMGGGVITGLGASLTSTASTLFISAGTNITMVGNTLPNADNTFTGGSSSFRYSVLYSAGGVVTTSDERMKTYEPENLGLAFINSLSPVSYNWKTDPAGSAVHHGLLAQDVHASLNGASFAGLDVPAAAPAAPDGMGDGCQIDGMTPYGLNYSEFIGPIIKAIQELSAEVTALKQAA